MSGSRSSPPPRPPKISSSLRIPALSREAVLTALLSARALSAALNILHDCDEVFNYWEPLHHLVYGWGLQTWEYGSQYALRSYWYLHLHQLLAWPASRLLGSGRGKLLVFYGVRAALGLASALCEGSLVLAVDRRISRAGSRLLLFFLCVSSGLFASSTALLPSSFAACALALCAASVVEGKERRAIWAGAIAVVWGWVVAAVAVAPAALSVLLRSRHPARACFTAGLASLCTVVPLAAADWAGYKRPTVSLLNFWRYNVAGGGESALYGVEPWHYYLRNGLTTLQGVLPLALAFPFLALLDRGTALKTLETSAPAYVWLLAISLLPHKEERFLYVVYPLLCLAAAGAAEVLLRGVHRALSRCMGGAWALRATSLATLALLAVSALLGASRAAALRRNYGAPLRLYEALPELAPAAAQEEVSVCVGAEWHRFPGAFHLPGDAYRLRFVSSGFRGLLPRQFDVGAPAPGPTPHVNDGNRHEPANEWQSLDRCAYMVARRDAGGAWTDDPGVGEHDWEVVHELPFVDAARSPRALLRAFYVPCLSERANAVDAYVLLRNRARL